MQKNVKFCIYSLKSIKLNNRVNNKMIVRNGIKCLVALIGMFVFSASETTYAGTFKKYELDVSGVTRQYYLYIPSHLSPNKKHPTVMAFHGYKSDAKGLRWLISPDKYADKYGFIIVYPDAINKSWNVGKGFGSANKNTDDVGFFKALTTALPKRHPIDSNKLYAMGFSNGAQAVTSILCKMPEKIAAAAVVAHTMNIDNCNPAIKVPTAVIHGQKDKMAPFDGGGKHNLASHKETIQFLKKLNEIKDSKGRVVVNKDTVRCTMYRDGKQGVELHDCVCSDSGHSWPKGREFMVKTLGKTNKELNANNYLFNFFSKQSNKNLKRNKTQIVRVGRVNAKVAAVMSPEKGEASRDEPVINYSRAGIPRKI